MSKEMVISATPHETRVAILEEGQLCEIYVEREKEFALVGSIYKGKVTRVLPGMQSAFVDIGLDSDAFLYVSDFLEDVEEFDHIVTTVEDKVQKMQEQGGQVFTETPESHAGAVEPVDVEEGPVAPSSLEGNAEAAAAPASESEQHPVSRPPQSFGNRPPERHHENRSRGGNGGRFGRGRRGRPGRRGRSGDRHFGRDLPPSKYASHRPYEPPTEESVQPGENYAPVILPGESLAKYKGRPAAVVPEPVSGDTVGPAAERLPQDMAGAPEVRHEQVSEAWSGRPPAEGGLEPLPGETLAKAHSRPTIETGAHTAFAAAPAEEPTAPPQTWRAPLESDGDPMDHQADSHLHGNVVDQTASEPELSEEEATALAEHVAEVQLEEAERVMEESAAVSADLPDVEDLDVEDEPEAEFADVAEDERADEQEREDTEIHAESEPGLESAESLHVSPELGAADLADPSADRQDDAQPAEPLAWNARVSGDYRARMQHPARRGRDRGRRDDRGRRHHRPHGGHGGHRPQPRRPQLISELLKQGQEIIVQIAKEPLGKKGARITSHIALPGRYLVYMPTLDHTGVSRKISSAEERSRLRRLVTDSKGNFGGGFIVRTAAEGASDEEIRTDVEFLTHTWSDIKSRSEQRKAPSLLHRDLNLVERILRDYLSPDYTAIWVDSEEEYAKVVEFVSRFQPQLASRVKLYTKETPVYEEFGIQQEIDKGLRPKVWLKSGGYIVINHTEALVAIDVNTGKFVGRGSTRLEDTIVRTNLEAVKEIVRQMRLRDLGGIIVIDFIDMEERRNREKVMAALEEALQADRAPSKVLRFNEFGLVAITRKRTKQALERTLCQPCPYCTGSGMVKSVPTLCYEIQAEARKMAPEIDSASLTLRVHPEIAKALKTRESALMEELERWTKKSIIIQADPTLHWEQYDIY
jgi:Rne/Rng family ribonuclease